MAIWMGGVAFLLFFLHDVNQITADRPVLRMLFPVGFAWLMAATAWMAVYDRGQFGVPSVVRVIGAVFCALFAALLIYSLFFALPNDGIYIRKTKRRLVHDQGVYALCRHPGVLWLFFGYECLGVCLESRTILLAGAWFSALNVGYVLFQERRVFPKLFFNYDEYQKTTPFLIPTKGSIARCLKTLR